MNRRNFLRTGAAGLLLPVAPAIVKAEWLMPVTAIKPVIEHYSGDCWLNTTEGCMYMFTDGKWEPIYNSVLTEERRPNAERATVVIDGRLHVDGPIEGILNTGMMTADIKQPPDVHLRPIAGYSKP